MTIVHLFTKKNTITLLIFNQCLVQLHYKQLIIQLFLICYILLLLRSIVGYTNSKLHNAHW